MIASELVGKRFGKLTVLSYDNKTHKCHCRCDCGNEKDINVYSLKNGDTTSCGCNFHVDRTGEKIGKLTLVEKLPGERYRCICECGNERIVSARKIYFPERMRCRQCAIESNTKAKEGVVFIDGTQPAKLQSKPTKANKSGVVGVSWCAKQKKWQAGIKFKGKSYNLGLYADFDEAVKARKKGEERFFEPFLEELESRKK